MAYLASKVSPTTRLILAFLCGQPEPQSSIDISDGIGCSYWTARDICNTLVASGQLTVIMRGKSPHYFAAVKEVF
jgi:hypothetical protein